MPQSAGVHGLESMLISDSVPAVETYVGTIQVPEFDIFQDICYMANGIFDMFYTVWLSCCVSPCFTFVQGPTCYSF